jgi:hypothetical protein
MGGGGGGGSSTTYQDITKNIHCSADVSLANSGVFFNAGDINGGKNNCGNGLLLNLNMIDSRSRSNLMALNQSPNNQRYGLVNLQGNSF